MTGHRGVVVFDRQGDHLSLFCKTCGYESSGIDIHTTPMRHKLMYERDRVKWERHRKRWTWMRSTGKAS